MTKTKQKRPDKSQQLTVIPQELLQLFLPPRTLDFFDCTGVTVVPSDEPFGEVYRIQLTEKKILPTLPEEYANRRVRFKGYTERIVSDFPIRGRKVVLVIRNRRWQIEGIEGVVRRDISVEHDGVKLTADFAFFFEAED